MKKFFNFVAVLTVVSGLFFGCSDALKEGENEIALQDNSYTSYARLFLNQFETCEAGRNCVANNSIDNSENFISYEDFLTAYVYSDETFATHYNAIISFLEDESLDIDDTNIKVGSYIDSVSDLDENQKLQLQMCGAAMEASLIYFSENDDECSRGLRSWLRKKKSRIINAAISGVCGTIIGGAIGTGVGFSVPVIGYIPGAIVGAVSHGIYSAKNGYDNDAVYITSGSIKL